MKTRHRKNPNAPGKGANVTVEPIRSIIEIRAIIKLLEDNSRDQLLFVMGVNNGPRVKDLLQIKVKQVRNAKEGAIIPINETKTKKKNILVINPTVYRVLQEYLDKADLSDDDLLFKKRHGEGAIKPGSVNKLIKSWTSSINLTGRYGCGTLRKTWGYIQRTVFGVGFEVMARRFNHHSPAITMRYLGTTDQEVYDSLMNQIE